MRIFGRRRRGSFYDTRPLEDANVDDITVGYKTFGAGPPLIMITGYIATMDIWDPLLLERLAEERQVTVFDNRGMGNTSAGDEEWTIDRFAEDAAGLLDELSLPRADVLGWSLGGDVALSMASRYPEKVSRLIVYAGDCGGEEKVDPPDFTEVLKDYKDVDARFKRMLAELFPPEWMDSHPDYWKSFQWPHEIERPDSVMKQSRAYEEWAGCFGSLGDFEMPVLIVTGTEDVSTPPENAVLLAQQIPHSWLVRFKGAGHGLQYQYPEQLARVILDFLDITSPEPRARPREKA